MSDRYPQLSVGSPAELGDWLAAHGAVSPGVWLVLPRKGQPGFMPREAVVEQVLAHGWVDSLPRKLDQTRSLLLLTPRKAASNWSKVNRTIVERLIAEGRMHPAGLAVVERARRDGRWEALDAVEALDEPPDLAAALDATPAARGYWNAFPRSTKRAILEWIAGARRDETRAARVAETERLAAENVRANQWRQPKGGR